MNWATTDKLIELRDQHRDAFLRNIRRHSDPEEDRYHVEAASAIRVVLVWGVTQEP